MSQKRTCFICGSDDGPTVTSVNMDVCGLGRVVYAMRCCAGCGLVLQDPIVPIETMLKHYAGFAPYTAFTTGDPPLISTAKRMLDLVSETGLTPGRVYDAGAATGKMLFHFRRAGWQVCGSDLSPVAVSQAKSLYDIDLTVASCEDGLAGEQGLDLVTLSHVLEHIYDPPVSLKAVRDALAPGGHFLMEVPCLISPERCPPGMFTMEHVNYFERTALTNLLGQAGLDVIAAPICYDEFLYPVITVLARKTSAPPPPIVSSFVDNMAFCEAYTARDRAMWETADARLRVALTPGEPVWIWSAGVQTSMLLSRTSLMRHADVRGLTDRDPQKQGHTVEGFAILPPAVVIASPHKIVVASYSFAADIEKSLLAQGVAPERIVQIY